VREDAETLAEQVASTATSLLVFSASSPIRCAAASIFCSRRFWPRREGRRDLDLRRSSSRFSPADRKVGVLELESFYPEGAFELAMAINNLLASPSFEAWLEGDRWTSAVSCTGRGPPARLDLLDRHLGDAERMFFVTLLLNRVLGWVRTQSGTSSLRAILYMDEIFGTSRRGEPPSKPPLLALLKQARAFGSGSSSPRRTPRTSTTRVSPTPEHGSSAACRRSGHAEGARRLMGGPPSRGRRSTGAGSRRHWRDSASGPSCFTTSTKADRRSSRPLDFSYLRGPVTRDEIRRLTAARRGGPRRNRRRSPIRGAQRARRRTGSRRGRRAGRSGGLVPAPAGRTGTPARASPGVAESFLPIAKAVRRKRRSSTARWCSGRPPSASSTGRQGSTRSTSCPF